MPVTLSVKAVPDALAERLRARAQAHHRSLQGELMAIIESAVKDTDVPTGASVAAKAAGTCSAEDLLLQVRAFLPRAVPDRLDAAAIVRAMRDARHGDEQSGATSARPRHGRHKTQ